MASRLLCKQSKEVVFLPSFRALGARIKPFSSENSDAYKLVARPQSLSVDDSNTVWPDKHLGPFSPSDERFKLPGHVGLASNLQSSQPLIQITKLTPSQEPDIIKDKDLDQQRIDTLNQFLQSPVEESVATDGMNCSELNDLECSAHDCPDLVKKDLSELFPGHIRPEAPLTVVTVAQKTQHDMSCWTQEMETERDNLTEHFIREAKEICAALHENGFWADFIDPASGSPYLSDGSQATLFETDERYRHFDLEIDDLGCCKVVRHRLWGTHAFIGTIFTDAPLNSPIMNTLMNSAE